MDRAIAEHSLFRPKPSKPETKDDITDHAARAIIGNEAALREAKTARLRQARLENEAKLAAAPASAGQQRGKAAKRRASLPS